MTAGSPFSVTVMAKTASGSIATGYTGTIQFASGDSQAGLPSSYTFVAADDGTHTFSAILKTAGTQYLKATDTTTSTITGTQSGIVVQPAAAKTLTVTGFPTPDTAGAARNFTVTAYDPYGNIATGYTGTIQFASGDSQAALPANFPFVATDNGTFTFAATLKTAGTQYLKATDISTSTITGTQSGIVVQPAAAKTLTVTGFPTPDTAGAASNFTVTAYDPYGNIATGYTGTIQFASSDSQAALPANFPFVATDNGTFTFAATLKTAGTQYLKATDTTTSTITGTQSGIVVQPAAAKSLTVTGFPTPDTAGAAGNFTVTAYDPYGNIATGYTGTIQFASGDSQAALPANFPFVATDDGTFTFAATLKTAGTQYLKATDISTSTITGTQSGIVVQPAGAASLAVTGFPTSVTAGAANNFTVTAYDPYGNIATGYTGTVHFTSTDSSAALPANYIFTTANAGSHPFTATLNTLGTQTIFVTDTVTPSITGSASATVNQSSASATLTKWDTSTEGNWQGVYGSQGYDIASGAVKSPSIATITPAGQTTYTWTTTSSDPRALQTPLSSNRVAAVWYSSSSFTIDVNLTDGQAHDIALYLLDWDKEGRVEQIQISSTSTGAILDTETVSNFSNGVYLQWNVTGNVIITITRQAGNNAIVNGVFIDPPSAPFPQASASFIAKNTATEGNWEGVYGSQGYDIVGGAVSIPSYALVTPAGQSSYTWTTTSSDPRALEIPNSSNRVAAAWYSGTSFTIDVNFIDGQAHDLALYALDWDTAGRAEQVQISTPRPGRSWIPRPSPTSQPASISSGTSPETWSSPSHGKPAATLSSMDCSSTRPRSAAAPSSPDRAPADESPRPGLPVN